MKFKIHSPMGDDLEMNAKEFTIHEINESGNSYCADSQYQNTMTIRKLVESHGRLLQILGDIGVLDKDEIYTVVKGYGERK